MAKSALSNLVRNVQFNVSGFSEIKKDLEALVKGKKQLLDQAEAEGKATKSQRREYEQLSKQLEKYEDDMNNVRRTIENLGNASPRDIAKLNTAFKKMSTTLSSMSDDARIKMEQILGKVAPVTQAMANEFKKGFTDMTKGLDMNNATFSQLQNFVQTFVKEGRDLALVAEDDAKAYAKMGENATNAMIQMGKMDGTLVALQRDASPERIAEYIAGWKRVAEFSGASAQQVQAANRKIADAQKLLVQKNMDVVNNPSAYAPKEVQDATQWLQKYLDTTKLTQKEQERLSNAIRQGSQYSKDFANKNAYKYYSDQLKNINQLSVNALAEQKKYWTEMMNGQVKGTHNWNLYKRNLEQVLELEQRQNLAEQRAMGMKTLGQFQNGAIKQTTTDIQAAIEKLTKFRGLLNQKTDASTIASVDNAVRQLNQELVKAQENYKLADKYLNATKRGGAFTGTIQDLQKVKAGLEDMRNKLRQAGEADKIADLDNKILKVEADIRTAGLSAQRFGEILKNPKGVSSVKELELAYERLKLQMRQTGLEQKKYAEMSTQLKAIKARMDEINGSAKKQSGIMSTLGSTMKNIVLHYVGLQMIFMRFINTMKEMVALSDKMTNVQKVTNMTAKEVEYLTRSLQSLDTRASTEQLLEFAEQAGKLGIYTERGVGGMQQFVEMAEKISRTLGEDIGGAKAVADLAKLNSILGVDRIAFERTGDAAHTMKIALDATGSAILNVGNNSAAGYAEIVNYVSRLGAIGSSSKMAATEIIALGGTLDALKMPAEAGSTALAQFIASVQRRTDEIARAAQLDVKEFRKLVNGFTDDLGNTVGPNMMGALQMLLGSINEGKASAQDLMDAMSGRSRTNVNIRNVLMLLSGHIEMLGDELKYANDGFESALKGGTNLSIMEREFARVNDNTAGKFERLGNMMKEVFVNPTTEKWMGKIADLLMEWVKWIDWMIRDTNLLDKAWNVSGIGQIISYFIKKQKDWNGELDSTKRIIGESAEGMREEIREASNLFAMLKNLNLADDERRRIIGEINNKYGTLLGFMLDEKASAKELANAYRLVCDQLREKARLEAKETALKRATENANSMIDTANEDLTDILEDTFGNAEQRATANVLIQKYAEDFAKKYADRGSKEISKMVLVKVAKEMGTSVDKLYNAGIYSTTAKYVTTSGTYNSSAHARAADLVQGILNRNKAEDRILGDLDAVIKVDEKMSGKNWSERIGLVSAKINEFAKTYQKSKTSVGETEEIIKALEGLVSIGDDGKIIRNANLPQYAQGSREDTNLKKMGNWLIKLRKDLSGNKQSIYGYASTSSDIKKMDNTQLANLHKQANEALSFEQDGAMWSHMFPDLKIKGLEDGMTAAAAHAIIDDFDEQLKAEADKRHISLDNLVWKHPAEKSGRKPKFEESEGAIAELDRYYSEREDRIRQMREREEISEAEMNRRVLANEKEHLTQRSKLRDTFTTKEKKKIEEFDAWWKSTEGLDELKRSIITSEWSAADDKAIKENNKKAQYDLTERDKRINEYNRQIHEILVNDNEFNKIINEFQDNLDKLGIMLEGMNSEDPATLANTTRERMNFVFSVIGDAYQLNISNLRQKIAEFGIKDWVLTDEQAQVLINRIQEFADTYDNTIRNSANRIKKTVDMYWKSSGNKEVWDSAVKEGEKSNKNNGWLHEAFGGQRFDQTTIQTDSELELYKLKIAASQAYIDQLEKEMDARILNAKTKQIAAIQEAHDAGASQEEILSVTQSTQAEIDRLVAEREYMMSDATINLNSLMEEFANRQTDLSMGLVRNLKPYQDMLVQFAEDFGSNVFGKKEDRQQAAKALLTTFVKTLNTMLTQYLIFLATRNLADKAQAGEELTTQGAKTAAIMGANAAEGGSKEVAKKGWAGFAIATAITVAMTALTSMMLSKINAAKAQIGVGNVGKLGGNMLTYAEGKYIETDANDGKRYKARYTDDIKTGVYHGPHMAVFSEKGDEMIIDHPTLVRTAAVAPWILRGIQDIHRHGKLTTDYAGLAQSARSLRLLPTRARRAYAEGNIDDMLDQSTSMTDASNDAQMMIETLRGVQNALEYLANNPVHIDMYGNSNSIDAKQKKLNGWKKRMGIR